MNTRYQVINTTENDLEFIHRMFDEAIVYQKQNNYPVWDSYNKIIVQNEVKEKRHFKILAENKIALIFSIMYSDKLYWREREKGNAVYLHRIVVNPDFKGQKLFGELLEWAIRHAQEKKLRILRMDTWGDNPNLISYYQSFGFRFIENYTTPNIPELPIPHRNLYLALLELDIGSYENNK